MLRIGLTGGIAAGKSLAAARFRHLGAVLVDADVLAREVVEPGTEGLRRIVEAFGPSVLGPDGALDRPALAAEVFGRPDQLRTLNAIVHPLVRRRAAELIDAAPADAIVVQDIPLLVEGGLEADFHLVVVVEAPEDVRISRMAANRAMTAEQARARIGAQATDADRRAAADVVLENTGTAQHLLARVDALWRDRLVPFERNIRLAAVAPREGTDRQDPDRQGTDRQGPDLQDYDQQWPTTAARLAARITAAAPRTILAVEHIGPTAAPGRPARNVIDLQVLVRSLAAADGICAALAAAGFPRCPAQQPQTGPPAGPDPAPGPAPREQRLHGNADPGRSVNVYVRTAG